MKKNHSVTAFYIETLLLIVVFLSIILVLTQIFGLARMQSASARQLTDAVTLAGNAAEAFSGSESKNAMLQLFNERDNAGALPEGNGVFARYDASLQPDADGAFRVEVTWEAEPDPAEGESAASGNAPAGLVRSVIRVLYGEDGREVYRLETAAYKGAKA